MKGESPGMKALEIFQICLAEVIGTAILVGIGCLGCLGTFGPSPPPWQGPFSFAFAIMISIQSIGHISGAHLNPAVTLGAAVLGVIPVYITIFYVISQVVGAIIGFGLIKVVTMSNQIHAGNKLVDGFCNTKINNELSLWQGIFVEAVATGILMFMISGLWDKRNSAHLDSAALKVGFCVFVLALVIDPYTCASMNPARSFGPALWNNLWDNHWAYWLGPCVGSLLASIIYKMIFSPNHNEIEEKTRV